MWMLVAVAVASANPALDAAIADLDDQGLLIGEAAVAHGGAIAWRRTAGGPREGAHYRIGSISKSMTAATLLTLVDEGAVGLDDPLSAHLPEVVLEKDGEPVRIRHLLHHTSGLGPATVGPFAVEPSFDTWWHAIEASEMDTLQATPGDRFAYSNGGYSLLTEVIRRKTGGSFEAALRARVLEPLGMRDTYVAVTPEARQGEVPGHVRSPLGWLSSRRMLPYWLPNDYRWDLGGAGAITSTVDDLVRFAEGLRTGAILSEASRSAMFTPALDDYAMGWKVERDGLIWHNGALTPVGVYAYLRFEPLAGRTAVLLAGTDLSAMSTELRHVVDAALDGGDPPEVSTNLTAAGMMATASALYLPWLVGLLPVGWLLLAKRREAPPRTWLIAESMSTLGTSVGLLSVLGIRGVLLGFLATVTVTRLRWSGTEPVRGERWRLRLAFGALALTIGGFVALVVLDFYQLIADPWFLFDLAAQEASP